MSACSTSCVSVDDCASECSFNCVFLCQRDILKEFKHTCPRFRSEHFACKIKHKHPPKNAFWPQLSHLCFVLVRTLIKSCVCVCTLRCGEQKQGPASVCPSRRYVWLGSGTDPAAAEVGRASLPPPPPVLPPPRCVGEGGGRRSGLAALLAAVLRSLWRQIRACAHSDLSHHSVLDLEIRRQQ